MNEVPLLGNLDSANILIIKDSPKYSVYKKRNTPGKIFNNRENKLLLNILEYNGAKKSDIVIKYLYPKYTKELKEIPSNYIDELNDLVKTSNFKVIISLGAFASQYLLGSDEPLKELRKRYYWSEEFGTWILPTYSPGAVFKKSSRFRRLKNDLEKINRLPKNYKEFKDIISTEKYVYTDADYCTKNINWLNKNATKLSMDIETTGFNWKKDDITELGITPSTGKSLIIPLEILRKANVRKALNKLFNNKDIVFLWQNGKFDCKFLWFQFGFNTRQDEDTMLQHYTIDEKRGTHSLTQLSQRYLNAYDYESDFKKLIPKGGNYGDAPDEARRKYLAHDTDYPFKINKVLYDIMDEDDLNVYKKVLIPASNMLMQVEMNGFGVDIEYLDKLDNELGQEVEDLRGKLQTIANDVGWSVPKYRKVTGRKSPKEECPFNPNSYPQTFYIIFNLLGLPKHQNRTSADEDARMFWLKKILNKPGDGEFETTEEYENSDKFKKWINDKYSNAFIYYLQKFKKVKKHHSTYVVGFKKGVWDDGKMHSTFLLHGTETGRLSSRNPNLQNIPREKLYKDMFVPSEGNVLMEVDFSQAELRVLAYLSQDEFLKNVYIDDKDLHDEVAIELFGENFTKEQRVKSKTINFGLAYGRTAYSIAETFDMSVEEAEFLLDRWFEQKPEAAKYIKDMRQSPHKGIIPKTVFGRKRRFGAITKKNAWAIENEAINFPIQSTASDLTLLSAIRLQPKLNNRAKIVNLVHDSIVLDVPKKYVKEIAKLTKGIMEETPHIYLDTEIPFKADVEIGNRWGSLKEVTIEELD